jgi:hypothetical protein
VPAQKGYGLDKHSKTERAFQLSLHELFLAVSYIIGIGAKALSLRLPPVVNLAINPCINRRITGDFCHLLDDLIFG